MFAFSPKRFSKFLSLFLVAKWYNNATLFLMRIRWDEAKRQHVLRTRGIDFASLADLLSLPYLEDQRRDDPEQYRLIGFVEGRLITFMVEYRRDTVGEYLWVVTAWKATRQEADAYERATRSY
jgi:uncharacterized DUF497 family protein